MQNTTCTDFTAQCNSLETFYKPLRATPTAIFIYLTHVPHAREVKENAKGCTKEVEGAHGAG